MTAFATGASQRAAEGRITVTIEGVPHAFGNFEADSSWWSGAARTFDDVLPWLRLRGEDKNEYLPTISGQRADLLRGRVSMGVAKFAITDLDGTLAGYMGNRRSDGHLRISRGASTTVSGGSSTTTVVNVVDASVAVPGAWVTIGSDTRRVQSINTAASPETITLTTALSGAPSNGTTVRCSELSASSTATSCVAIASPGSSPNTLADFPSSGNAWVDAECVGFTRSSGTLTLTRGKYGSRIQQHRGGLSPTEVDQDGALLTSYPRGLVGRRAWVRLGFDATSDTDCVNLLAGQVTDAQWIDGRTLAISIEDSQAWIRRPLFSDLGKRLNKEGVPPTGDYWPRIGYGNSGVDIPVIVLDPETTEIQQRATDGEEFCVIFGGNLVVAKYDQTLTEGVGRPILRVLEFIIKELRPNGTVARDVARYGIQFREAIVLGREGPASFYNSVKDWGDTGGHPLRVLLKLLLSTGTGTNSASWDHLSADWGVAIPAAEVDVAGIEALANRVPALHWVIVTEPVADAREFIVEKLLRPFCFYLTSGVDASLTVRHLGSVGPEDIENAVDLTIDDIVVDKDGHPIRLDGPTFEDKQIAGPLEITTFVGFLDGEPVRSQPIKLMFVDQDSNGLYVDGDPIKVNVDILAVEDNELLPSRIVAAMRPRYGVPPAVLRVAVRMKFATLEPGDLVSVTLDDVPNCRSSTRGLTNEAFEVVGKAIDLKRGIVELDLLQSGIGNQRTRYIAPALDVTAWNDGTKVATVTQNAFTAGGLSDSDAFGVNDRVRVYSADLASRSAVTFITAKTSSSVTLNDNAAALGVTPASGFVIMHADYADTGMTAALTSKWSFRAGNDQYLSSTTQPHIYAS